jgi:8-oxo-dGTP pyrophosphatase MutT (NUDIX family)
VSAIVRKASTVILLNDSFEVLLMQRSTHDSFMAKASVYPGGALDESDGDEALLRFCRVFNGKKAKALLKNPDMDEKTAFSLFFAAIRELFEESSILLAEYTTGEPLHLSVEPVSSRFKEYRKAIYNKELSLARLAELEGLVYTPEKLTVFAHWITPTFQKKRFDTWFFLTPLSHGQNAMHDNNELTSAEWMKPQKALEMNDNREILLMPPTIMTLRELSSFNSIDELLIHAAAKNIPAILPEAFAEGNTAGVILPINPAYSNESLKLSLLPGEPSRVILDNGFWRIES